MKIVGIIAEYNPFHTGHAYHIQKTRELTGADYIVVVMSGDFVQRGAPALYSKHLRTRMALLGGADLVFELPATHACESAEFFAQSAVGLLDGLGCVDVLSFGSESGDIEPFLQLGAFLATETPEYQNLLKEYLKKGESFPKARSLVLQELLSDTDTDTGTFLQTPNNILGVEYCKALCRRNSPIRPFTVKREGNAYHEESLKEQFPSASAIRALWKSADCKMSDSTVSSCFPPAVSALLSQTFSCPQFLDEEDFSPYLRWLLFSTDKAQLASYQDVTPDFVQRLFHTRGSYESWGQYAALLKTRELTYSRICRMLMHCLLQISHVPALSYARLLGFRRQAAPVLSELKKHSSIPVITKAADASSLLSDEATAVFSKNVEISNLYETVWCEKYRTTFVHEYRKPLVILP